MRLAIFDHIDQNFDIVFHTLVVQFQCRLSGGWSNRLLLQSSPHRVDAVEQARNSLSCPWVGGVAITLADRSVGGVDSYARNWW